MIKPINLVPGVIVACLLATPLLAEENSRYQKSIRDAAIIEQQEIVDLQPLTGNTAQVVTWTKYPSSYKPGQKTTLAWGETWVTMDGAVKAACQQYKKNKMYRRIQQLLGLPPEEGSKRYFVVLQAKTSDMFRPCANPSLTATRCTANFPDDVSQQHKAWYASQSANSYNAANGYPWTRLGYTYNWNPKQDEVGPNEFVIKQGSEVTTLSVTATMDYCQ